MTGVEYFSFEVVPVGWDGMSRFMRFEPFIVDVPYIDVGDHDKCARRAYFQAFTMLGNRGVEPEEFEVYVHGVNGRGTRVDAKGVVYDV